jgi:positive regulator of sigma E activity
MLIRKSRSGNEEELTTIFGIMLFFTPTIVLYLRYINNKFIFSSNEIMIFLGMYLASVLIIYLSVKEYIIRRKIKKNFESLGIGDEL